MGLSSREPKHVHQQTATVSLGTRLQYGMVRVGSGFPIQQAAGDSTEIGIRTQRSMWTVRRYYTRYPVDSPHRVLKRTTGMIY